METKHEKSALSDILTPEQVAEYLQLPLDIVLTGLEQAEIPGVRIGNIWRVPRNLLERWLEQRASNVFAEGKPSEPTRQTAFTGESQVSDQKNLGESQVIGVKLAQDCTEPVPPSPVPNKTSTVVVELAELDINGSSQAEGEQGRQHADVHPPERKVKRVQGVVKTFNPGKGFGFIKADDGREVFVHAVDVEDYGQTLKKRDRVMFEIRRVPKGWQAYDVVIISKTSRRSIQLSKPPMSTPAIPKRAQIAFERALAARELGDYKRARELFEEAIRKGPFLNVFQAYSAMEEKENPENAARVLEKGIKYFPDAGILYNDYAMLKRRSGDLSSALDILRRGLDAAPAFARQLHWSLAVVLVEMNREEDLIEAAEHARRAKELGQRLKDDWRYVKLQVLTGPPIGKLAYQFFEKSGFNVKFRSFNRQWADLLVSTDLSEYVETYDLHDRMLVRCFYSSVTHYLLNSLQDTLRNLSLKRRDINTDIAFLVADDITPLRDTLYRLMSDNREAIVPIDSASLAEVPYDQDPSNVLRPVLDQWLSRRDLYRFNYPVYGRRFFGRELDLQRLMRDIDDGHNVGVFGLRKVGKTSLLLQLRELRPQDIVIYFDVQGVPSDAQDCAYIYWAIACKMREEVEKKKTTEPKLDGIVFKLGTQKVPRFQKRTPRLFDHDVQTTLARLEHQMLSTRIILILDEVDRLLPSPEFSSGFSGYPDFFAYLRGVSQNSNGRFVTIITAANPALCEQATWEGRDNPIFQFYHQMFLPPLARDDCIDMIVKLGRGMGIDYDEESMEAIFRATSGHPYLTRLLCSQIAQLNPIRPLHVTLDEVNQARNEFLRGEATPIFNEILERLDSFFPVERDLLLFIADNVDSEVELEELVEQPIDVALYHLVGYQIVGRTADNYRIKIDLLRDWLRRYRLGRKE